MHGERRDGKGRERHVTTYNQSHPLDTERVLRVVKCHVTATYLQGELEAADVNVETVTGGQEHLGDVCEHTSAVHCHLRQMDTIQVLQIHTGQCAK